MGSAWVLAYPNVPPLSFNATIVNSPTSVLLAELSAVAAAIVASPHNVEVEICTDSLVMINHYNLFVQYFMASPTFNPTSKIANYGIWHALFRITSSKNIILKFTKITAHSNDHFNEQADALAKKSSSTHYLSYNINGLGNKNILCFNNHPINISPRYFIKDVLKALRFNNFADSPHFRKYCKRSIH
jgi:ribonuclease HI